MINNEATLEGYYNELFFKGFHFIVARRLGVQRVAPQSASGRVRLLAASPVQPHLQPRARVRNGGSEVRNFKTSRRRRRRRS